MVRRLLGSGLLLALLTSCTASAPGQDKKKKADPPPTADADTLPAGQYAGKLKNAPGSDGSFVLAVEYQHLELTNPKALQQFMKANPQLAHAIRDQQHIATLQNQLARARNQYDAARIMGQLQNA